MPGSRTGRRRRPPVKSRDDARAQAKIQQLENLAAAVRSPRPLAAVIDLVIGHISEVVPASAAAIWVHDGDNDLWYIAGSVGLTRRASQVSFASDQTLHSRVGDGGEIVTNLSSAGFRRLYPEHDLISCALYAPMKVAGRRVGLIALYRNDEPAFSSDDLRYVRTVGASVGMAITFAVLEARAERLAVQKERLRLGADLHDGIMQILSSVSVYAQELRSVLEPVYESLDSDLCSAVSLTLSRLENCISESSAELSATIRHLRRPDASVDFRQHLDLTARRLKEAGIEATVSCDVADLSPEVADALGWIMRESVTNVLRHSRARAARLTARSVKDQVELVVWDDGVGSGGAHVAENDEAHLGSVIMEERASAVGGTLAIRRAATGTTVRARLPAVVPAEAV